MSEVWVLRSADVEAGALPVPAGGPWRHAVLKPNWVRHYNERAPGDPRRLAEVVTSPALLLQVARRLAGRAAAISVADAPQFDADWEELCRRLDVAGLVTRARQDGVPLDVRDLRQEVVWTDANDVIVHRDLKMGDPQGYRVVDLGAASAFQGSGFDFQRLRGADLDARETIAHHTGGKHEYCVSGTVLGADLVVNVAKLKTHKKSGVTLCLKNLVGINGNKNYLPHHRAGRPEDGGDEFPGGGGNPYRRLRAWAIDRARPFLRSGALLPLVRAVRRVDVATRPARLIRNGNWSGNDTIWRTILDLNRALLYANAEGRLRDAPQRQTFHVIDGIVAGEGDGPMAPDRRDADLVIASADPVAADAVAAALMGFDPTRIPVIREACRPHPLPITRLGPALEGLAVHLDGRVLGSWRELPSLGFRAHPGWAGRIERDDRPAPLGRPDLPPHPQAAAR